MTSKNKRLPKSLPSKLVTSKRINSGTFSQLTTSQIQELKEAFALLDKDGDGVVDRDDLKSMLTSLNQDASDEALDQMLSEVNPPINLASFLTAIGSMLCKISPRADLMEAFYTIEDTQSGKMSLRSFEEALSRSGSDIKGSELEDVIRPYTNHGTFYYEKFVNAIAGTKEN
ncbi:myosin II regulatory light chain Rlc1 [Schizosaccharomyces japonicus yFS275]|uniref:Myosin II regulatory light chain Rlc1 n=1 Tax=Schizosaccharomyces japonicus (strain yFS275 / FY16936) TaxID=402676 RepID=B6JYK4_SCHJY|nr:myosin II regulatory light chain Rlc1 [Schizosaccharomyces japonicus yFS275]EEB06622.1 myosin II regulatory light chain Rlc1 [Schizosaccharomyces japonicus yFS275]